MRKHILLVDDNPDDLEFYGQLLEDAEEDYIVHCAESVKDALHIFRTHKIYCTFLDYHMPEVNGLKALEILCKEAGQEVLPVIIFTGERNQAVQAEAARKGALNYIVKDATNTSKQLSNMIKETAEWVQVMHTHE